ncbi:hypothetical protein U6B65_09375 [Oscillospiraceae bacterium MB08-C2-2]|nr:hypothetical protein U6B65_09375 [Oscillospiraceae bacterium MB08-C2-2]
MDKSISYYPPEVSLSFSGQKTIATDEKDFLSPECYTFDVNYQGKIVSKIAVDILDSSIWILDMSYNSGLWLSENSMELIEYASIAHSEPELYTKLTHSENTTSLYFACLDTIPEFSNRNEGTAIWNKASQSLHISVTKATGTGTGAVDGPSVQMTVSWAEGSPIIESVRFDPAPIYSQPSQVLFSGETLAIEKARLIEIAKYFKSFLLESQ